ncbi:MAG: IS91 family transposase, partial [Thermodesulfobacteriota bacterium]|nr:IS91 family transposase [Thermodesulfobacteriota bacterium]
MLSKNDGKHSSVSSNGNNPEVADIFRLYGEDYRKNHNLSFEQLKVMRHISICRTAALGGHIKRCNQCGYEQNAYNSCRNRHCPKCQTMAKEKWLNDRKAELLPVGYFHLVFTLPHELNPIILYNKRILLDILFQAVNETLQAFAGDPQWRLKGQLGFIAVLHTWSQTLMDHFHLHCLIPAGALSFDKDCWVPAGKKFLFRVESMSKAFRRLYIQKLKAAYKKNQLVFPGNIADEGFNNLIKKLKTKKWIMYAKRPFTGPEKVVEYLGRYTHRVAISNHRIISIDDGKVIFSYKDRNDGNKRKFMTLKADEFIRRFLLHVLPQRFVKIRYFGFMFHRDKQKNIELIRKLLGTLTVLTEKVEETVKQIMLRVTGIDISVCPKCGKGRMIPVVRIPMAWYLNIDLKG